MEVWGPPEGSTHHNRKRAGSRPCPPLQHFDHLFLSANRLACRVRGFRGEAGWTRRACVSPAVLLAVFRVLPSESACDVAHLRCSARLIATSQRCEAHNCLRIRAAAHAALPSDDLWAQAGPPLLSAYAGVARVRPTSLSLPLLSCWLPGVCPPEAHASRGHMPSLPALLWTTSLAAAVGVALAVPCILILFVAPSP
jgi:hypothetical protein